MNFKIDPKILERFPGLNIGVVIIKSADNSGASEEILTQLKEREDRIKSAQPDLSTEPKIESWRKAYAAFGAKPKEDRSSVENLYRLVLRGVSLRHINKLVDIYNLISLKHTLPVGGEDTDKIKGDILLTFAGPNETPVLLLGDKEPHPPKAGEVVYKDGISTICRRWNWREADRTKLTEQTKNCILVIEGLPPISRQEIESATSELARLVEKHCKAVVSWKVLHHAEPESPSLL